MTNACKIVNVKCTYILKSVVTKEVVVSNFLHFAAFLVVCRLQSFKCFLVEGYVVLY